MSFQPGYIHTAHTALHQPIIIRTSKLKQLQMIALALVFIIVSLWLMNNDVKPGAYGAGLMGTLFCSFCLIVLLIQMCTSSPLLTIDEQGIRYRHPLWGLKDVRWEEIAYICPIQVLSITLGAIYVSPSGIQTYLARNRKFKKLSSARYQSDAPIQAFTISFTTATLSYQQTIAQIQEQYGDLLARYQISIYDVWQ